MGWTSDCSVLAAAMLDATDGDVSCSRRWGCVMRKLHSTLYTLLSTLFYTHLSHAMPSHSIAARAIPSWKISKQSVHNSPGHSSRVRPSRPQPIHLQGPL